MIDMLNKIFKAPIKLIVRFNDGKEQTLDGEMNQITGIYKVGQIETTRDQLSRKIKFFYGCKLMSIQ